MTRFVAAFVAVLVVALSAAFGAAALQSDPQHPPHVRPADSGRESRPSSSVEQEREAVEAIGFLVWVVGRQVEGAIWEQMVEQAVADLARERAARSNVGGVGPGVAVECGNSVLPDAIVRRESGGRCDAYNASGCGGRGCLGYAQVDAGHFAEQSPWNPNVSGSCYGLSYNECVEKLWNDGAGAGHWR